MQRRKLNGRKRFKLKTKKEQMENELREREKASAVREEGLNELPKKGSAFPKELEATISKVVKETTEKLTLEAKNREGLIKIFFA